MRIHAGITLRCLYSLCEYFRIFFILHCVPATWKKVFTLSSIIVLCPKKNGSQNSNVNVLAHQSPVSCLSSTNRFASYLLTKVLIKNNTSASGQIVLYRQLSGGHTPLPTEKLLQQNKAMLLIGHVISKSRDTLVTIFISPCESHAHSYLRYRDRQADKDVSM